MRKLFILTSLMLLLVACGQQQTSSPDVSPSPEMTEGTLEEEPPRVEEPEATPDPGLPATYTPAPMLHGGHLYLVGGGGIYGSGGSGGSIIGGTRVIHLVQPGDTLGLLCNRYGVSVETIARANDINNWDHIEVGASLIIPLGNG